MSRRKMITKMSTKETKILTLIRLTDSSKSRRSTTTNHIEILRHSKTPKIPELHPNPSYKKEDMNLNL